MPSRQEWPGPGAWGLLRAAGAQALQSPSTPPWTDAHKDREPVLAQLCPGTEGTPSFRRDRSYFQNDHPGERRLEGVNT